jgi:hypothetical protein
MSSETMKKLKMSAIEPTVTQRDGEVVKIEDIDVAAKFLESLDASIKDVPITAAEARKVLWKIDLCILSLLAGTIILSAVDKVIISNAVITD